MDDDFPDDDIPWADPAIRTEYEAALGRFILAYNEADYRVSQVITASLSKRGHAELAATAAKGSFLERLEKLELLMSDGANTPLSGLPVAKLRTLHGDRNKLAHGHFDQNPYDGSYKVIQAAKARDYPVPRVLELAAELSQLAERLRTVEILHDFDDLTLAQSDNP